MRRAVNVLLVLMYLVAGTASAQEAPDPQLEALLRPLFEEAVSKQQAPGAVVVVVRDGRVVLARGYGLADVARQTPVDPERTLFYLASVTKPFTATAAMQLVEQGKLDLNGDVNATLREFRVPATFPQPVTLAHLLTHTAGFDDKNIGYVTLSPETVRPLGQYLATELPRRVRPPGEVTSYSNHGYGLAGYLVEVASGRSYAEYVEANIFQPLGMTRSTARIPLPEQLAGDLATGYQWNFRTEAFAPQPLGYRNLPPAGTISATAADVAKFMLAHLQDGRLGDTRILSEETARRMHGQQFTHHPRLPGMCFGFYEREHGPLRVLEHAGGYIGYAALLALVPERNTGIFIAVNTTSSALTYRALNAFLDHVAPATGEGASPTTISSHVDLARFEGDYHITRYSRHSVEKIALWDGVLRVSTTPQGGLRLAPRQGRPTEWVRVEPFVYRRTGSDELLVFREDSSGRIAYFFRSGANALPVAYERLSPLESLQVQIPSLLALAVAALSTFTAWPLAAGIRRWVRRRQGRSGDGPRAPRLPVAVAVACGLMFIAFVGALDSLIGNSSYRVQLVYGMTAEMVVALWIPIALTLLSPLLVYWTMRAWQQHWWSTAGRLYYSLIALAAVAQIVFFLQWNLLGFQY